MLLDADVACRLIIYITCYAAIDATKCLLPDDLRLIFLLRRAIKDSAPDAAPRYAACRAPLSFILCLFCLMLPRAFDTPLFSPPALCFLCSLRFSTISASPLFDYFDATPCTSCRHIRRCCCLLSPRCLLLTPLSRHTRERYSHAAFLHAAHILRRAAVARRL